MILTRLDHGHDDIERLTGWDVRAEGACRGDLCVPLADGADGATPIERLAGGLGMPLVRAAEREIWALGPESGTNAPRDARMPELALPDVDGALFDVASLRGSKVLLVSWASW